MANSLLTMQQVTRKALALFLNTNYLIKNVNRQYDGSFAQDGAKIGSTLKIRLPNDYYVRTGPTFVAQDTVEPNTSLTISTQKGVDVSFSSADLALSLDDFGDRILKPMMNKLSSAVAVDLMSTVEGVPNLVHNVDGSNNTIAPTFDTWLAAGAILDQYGVPRGDNRIVILDPQTQRRTVNSFSGFFNAQSEVGKQYRDGVMDAASGFRYHMDQTVIKHTTGTFSAGTVNGGSQTGTTLTVNAITGTLAVGDVITIAGVNSVNRSTGQDNGTLAQFTVTAAASNGATSISVYPAITPVGATVQYATVTASPANSAAITLATKASEVYRKNIAFDPRAITFASADLKVPQNAVESAYRASFGGVSMRVITDYIFASDQWGTRFDILYGYKLVRPEWVVAVGDAL